MRYGYGAEEAAVMAKIVNIENMIVWFHSCGAVAEQHAVVLQIFSAPWNDLYCCCRSSTAESGRGLHF